MNTKICSKCGVEFPDTREFFKWSVARGTSQPCRSCVSTHEREYRTKYHDKVLESKRKYKRTHRKQVDAYNRQWEHDHPEQVRARRKTAYDRNPDTYREKTRRHYWKRPEENRERVKQAARLRRKKRPEEVRQYKRDRLKNYPDQDHIKRLNRATGQRRKARKRNLLATFTVVHWQRCLDYFSNCCAYCGRPRGLWHTLAQDHFIPLTKSGGYTPDNIVPACDGIGGCNQSKSNSAPHEWIVRHFGPRKAKKIAKRIEDYFEWVKHQGS